MKARLLRGVGANLYAQAVTSLIQVAAVPALLSLWGPARYGTWTLLSAVPAALAFADGGLVLATGTAMTMAVARGDTGVAAALFRRAVRVVGIAALVAGAVAAGASLCVPPGLLPSGLPDGQARTLLLCFALTTLAGLCGTLPGAAFGADRRYAAGVVLGATLRAAEMVAVLAAAVTAGLVGAAAAWLCARAAGVLLQFFVAWRRVGWLRQSLPQSAATRPSKSLVRPALAAMALPAAFALSLQGVTVAAGAALAPAAVAAFVTARTLARLIVQSAGLVNHALMPEMSRVAGRGDDAAADRLLRFSRFAAAGLLLPGYALLLVAGPHLFDLWTGGRLGLPRGVLPLTATAALVHGLWLARANLLLAVNRQGDYAWMFLVVAGLTAAAAALAGRATGLVGVAAASLGGEVAMALWIGYVSRLQPAVPARRPGPAADDRRQASGHIGASPTVTAILACHNRRTKTLTCLETLARQDAACDLRVILFDDGSTDGTAAAVRRGYPAVEIITGPGDAFWAGGMRSAFEAARADDPDFVLWLNDDVRLAPHALRRLLDTHAELERRGRSLSLIGGAVADPVSGRTTYAGIGRPRPRCPLRFRHLAPHASEPRRCETLVGNVVLVPRLTAATVGGIDPVFRHTLADLDYGLRVGTVGGWVGLAPGHLGWCVREAATGRWFDGALPLVRRWRTVNQPLGFPLRPWLHFTRRHGGTWWMLFAPLPYWRLFVPVALARRVDLRRMPPRPAREVRHA